MSPETRRLDRPGLDKRMLSVMLFAQGAILVVLAVVVAVKPAWAGALGLALLLCLIGALVRSRGY